MAYNVNSGSLLMLSGNAPGATARVGIGTDNPSHLLEVNADTTGQGVVRINQHANDSDASQLEISKGRGTHAAPAAVSANDYLGVINFKGYDGNSYDNFGQIYVQAGSEVATDNHPGKMYFRTTPFDSVTLSTAMVIEGTNVSGAGDLSAVGNLTVGGTLNVSGAATYAGSSTFGNISGSGTLQVVGVSRLGNNLHVSGTISGSSTIETVGATTLGSTLNVSGASTFASAISSSGPVHIDGATTIGNALTVTGAISNTAAISSSSTLLGRNLDIGETGFVVTPAGNISGSGTLLAQGATTLGSTLAVSGATTMAGQLTVINGVDAEFLGNTTFGNQASDTITFTGETQFNAPISSSTTLVNMGAVTLGNSLTVSGSSALGVVTVNTISGSSTSHIVGAASFGSTLAVTGAISSSATLIGNVLNIGASDYLVTADGNVSGSGTLQAVGATILGNTLVVSGTTTAAGDLNVGDDLSLTSDSAVFNMGAGSDFTITHDGTTGATIAGNPLTLDSGGDIVLDAASAGGISNVTFKGDGTAYANFVRSSNNCIVSSSYHNGDIIFHGDSAQEIGRFDGSAGALLMNTNKKIRFADGGEYIVGDGTNLTIASGEKILLSSPVSGSGTLQAVGATILGSTLTVSGAVTAPVISGSKGKFDLDGGSIIFSGSIYGDGSQLTGISTTPTSLSGTTVQLTTGVETSGYLKVTGSSTLGAVTATTISGSTTLHNVGVATFGNAVYSSGSVTADGLTSTGVISGSNVFHSVGVATFGNSIAASGSISGSGTLEAVGSTVLGSTLSVSGAITAPVISGSKGKFDLDGGSIIFTGSIIGDGSGLTGVTATVTSLSGTIAQLTTGVETSGYLKVTGSSTLGAISGSSTLYNVGAATFSSTIASTGSVTAVGLYSTDIISGSAGLHIDLPATFGGVLSVTGAVSGAATLQTVGATILGSTLSVSGTITAAAISASAPLTVTSISASGESHFSGNVGIGTKTPLYDLHVNGAGVTVATIDAGASSDAYLKLSTAGTEKAYLKLGSGGNLILAQDATGGDLLLKAKPGGASTTYLTLDGGATTIIAAVPIVAAAITATTISASSTLQAVGTTVLGSTLSVSGAITAPVISGSKGKYDLDAGVIIFTGSIIGDGSGLTGVTAGAPTSLSGTTAQLTTGVETSGYLKVSGSSTFAGDITATCDTVTIQSTNSTDPVLILKNTNTDGNGARLRFVKDAGEAGSPTDVAGTIEFYADDANQDQVLFARIEGKVEQPTEGQEGGLLAFGIASHDGEMSDGLLLIDGNAEDEVNVVIGNAATSLTSIAGVIKVGGNVIQASDGGTTITLDTDDNVTVAGAVKALLFSGSSGLVIDGASTLGGTLSVTGSVAAAGLTSTAAISASSTLHNVGVATFGNSVSTTGSITVGGGTLTYGPGQDAFLKIADGAGTNTNGRELVVEPGKGTGTGIPGLIKMNVPKIGTSGGTVQENVQILEIRSEGMSTMWNQATSMLDNEGMGDIVYFGTGTTVAGKTYYLHTASSWHETDAGLPVSGSDAMLGLAVGTNPASNGMLIRGFFDVNTYTTGAFKAGQAVYASTASGYVATNRPSGSGEYVRILGHATSTSKVIYFNPGADWIELS